jgi:hypothetical protein
MGPTTELRRALKARFFSYAVDRGFVLDARHQPVSTTFRRPAGAAVQIFDVQWDKYGKPRFALNFGTCPVEGMRIGDTIHRADDVLPGWCPDSGRLQPGGGSGTRHWFRQDSTLLRRVFGAPVLREPAVVVEELMALFPEVERYWTSREAGPHLRLWHRR